MRAAIFLDRDGVINENRDDYVKSWAEFVFLPGVLRALRRLAESRFAVVVISNQSAVGRKQMDLGALEEIHRQMTQEIARAGGRIDGIFYCPHQPTEDCPCRKPRPGLLQQAAASLGLDLGHSFLVGDAQSDMEAALNAGCQPVLVLTGRGRAQFPHIPPAILARCHVADDLDAAVSWILSHER